MESVNKDKYLEEMGRRQKRSRIYRRFQLIGLEIAMHLEDEKHKSLYIKLAKEGDMDRLLALARNIGENRKAKNKGAYFMRMWREEQRKNPPLKKEEKNGGKKQKRKPAIPETKKINNKKAVKKKTH